MNRLVLLVALAAAVALALAVRLVPQAGDPLVRSGVYSRLDDSESAYRLRLVELALATEHAPAHDRFLEPSGPADIPWPPLLHAGVAVVAAHSLGAVDSAPEIAGIDETRLERFALGVGPVLGVLATLAAALFALSTAPKERRLVPVVLAALLWALFPLSIARESVGTLHPHGLVAVLGLVQLASLAIALRAAERIDVTVGALACGIAAGLGQLAGPESWPISVSVAGTLAALAARKPKPQARDAWRVVLLYLASALAVMSIPEADDASARWLPDFERGLDGLLHTSFDTLLLTFSLVLLALLSAWPARRDPLRAALIGVLFLSLACALFDRRFFAPLAVAGVTLLTLALQLESAVLERRARALVLAWLVACGSAVLFRAAVHDEPEPTLASGLRWLRDRSSSPGAFNHPDAEQSWRVAAPPELFGSVALHARRPVLAASYDGGSTGDLARLRELFASPDAASLARALALSDCPYLVVTPLCAFDRQLGLTPDSFVARLALDEPGELAGELERVFASAERITISGGRPGETGQPGEPAGPALSIYRRLSGAVERRVGPTLSPAGR